MSWRSYRQLNAHRNNHVLACAPSGIRHFGDTRDERRLPIHAPSCDHFIGTACPVELFLELGGGATCDETLRLHWVSGAASVRDVDRRLRPMLHKERKGYVCCNEAGGCVGTCGMALRDFYLLQLQPRGSRDDVAVSARDGNNQRTESKPISGNPFSA